MERIRFASLDLSSRSLIAHSTIPVALATTPRNIFAPTKPTKA